MEIAIQIAAPFTTPSSLLLSSTLTYQASPLTDRWCRVETDFPQIKLCATGNAS